MNSRRRTASLTTWKMPSCTLDGYSADFELLEGEDVLRLHAFVDRSVLEVFVNRRECGTLRPFHNIEDKAMRLFSEGGTARIRSVDVWEMGSIWKRATED